MLFSSLSFNSLKEKTKTNKKRKCTKTFSFQVFIKLIEVDDHFDRHNQCCRRLDTPHPDKEQELAQG